MDTIASPLRCFGERHALELLKDDGIQTVTSAEQVSQIHFASLLT